MPVTIRPTEVEALPYDVDYRGCGTGYKLGPAEFRENNGRMAFTRTPVNLRGTPPRMVSNSAELLDLSLSFEQPKQRRQTPAESGEGSSASKPHIYASSLNEKPNDQICSSINGFIQSAVDAYSGHHHLVIRPDDIWITILTQLSFYVNDNAEELRHLLVSHEGVMSLEIIDDKAVSVSQLNFRRFLDAMPTLMQKYIKDADLRAWIQQDFSTTTNVDRAVTSIIFMSAMQKYFDYTISTRCALPSVTLDGSQQDWEQLLAAVDKFTFFGTEPVEWRAILRPVLQKFVDSFREPTSDAVIDFWQRMVKHNRRSGGDTMTGWLTAFCYFNPKGKPISRLRENLAADGVIYRSLKLKDIPLSHVTVPLSINNTVESQSLKATMRAGCVGMAINGAESGSDTEPVQFDTLRPLVGWWIYNETAFEKEEREQEEKVVTGKAIAVMR